MSKDNYSPKISKDGKALLLETKVPAFFIDPGRLLLTNQEHRGFNNNTSECVAFSDVAQKINDELDYSVDIKGDPQVVALPFKVEQDIVTWEVQAFINDDDEVNELLQSEQYFYILKVIMVSVDKPRTPRNQGGMRVFGTPNNPHKTNQNNQQNSADDYWQSMFGSSTRGNRNSNAAGDGSRKNPRC